MEMRELEYVVAIAEEKSLSKAAARLYLSQSSLSQFLSRYEAELGAKLFVRSSGGMRPTIAGESFVEDAKLILRQYQRMCANLKEVSKPSGGHIEFGISSFRGRNLIPAVLKKFSQLYPDIELVIHEHDSFDLRKMINTGELDMALVALRAGQEHPRNVSLIKDEVLLVARTDHPIMEYVHVGEGGPDRPWVNITDAAKFKFLLSNRFTVLGSIAQHQFDTYGLVPGAVLGNLTAAFAMAMAWEGLGLAFTYASCIEQRDDVVYLSIGKERCYVDIVLIYPPNAPHGRANKALEEIVRQYIKGNAL